MTSFEQYTPRNISALDALAAAKRTADQILRSNPLTNATVTSGLMQWKGNHVDSTGERVDYIWIGDFFPADTTMGGIPQKGIVFRRDDSTSTLGPEGTLAFALYDHNPGGDGLGLRQTIHWESIDRKQLWQENRKGGQSWPEYPVPMGPWGDNISKWPGQSGASFGVSWDGWANIVGNQLVCSYTIMGEAGAAGEAQVQVLPNGGPPVLGPIRTHGAGAVTSWTDTIDVSSMRGETRRVQLMQRVTNGVGRSTSSVISFRCYTQ